MFIINIWGSHCLCMHINAGTVSHLQSDCLFYRQHVGGLVMPLQAKTTYGFYWLTNPRGLKDQVMHIKSASHWHQCRDFNWAHSTWWDCPPIGCKTKPVNRTNAKVIFIMDSFHENVLFIGQHLDGREMVCYVTDEGRVFNNKVIQDVLPLGQF